MIPYKVVNEFNPWERNLDKQAPKRYQNDLTHQRPKFSALEENRYLDINTKRAALSVAPSVVSLVSYTGEEELYQCCGTIIESEDTYTGIILTTANLIRPHTDYGCAKNILADKLKVVVNLSNARSFDGEICAHDFHYNLAVVRFRLDFPIQTAKLRQIDDRQSLSPGDDFIVVGRYFVSPFSIMAAPGEYRRDRCKYDCKEIFMSTCHLTRCGDGSPFLNSAGEVIGVAFYDISFTPFMPINVAYKWWEHYKIYREYRRPLLGLEAIALHSGRLSIVEKVIQRFPSISSGLVVKKVISGSSAESAGLCKHDVIVQCGARNVQSFLEFFEIMWDNVGHPLDLVVVRADHVTPLTLKLMVVEAKSDQLNSWPRRRYW